MHEVVHSNDVLQFDRMGSVFFAGVFPPTTLAPPDHSISARVNAKR